jgi:phosphohistidine phosphatase SixA
MRMVLAIWMCLTAGAVAAEPTEALKAPGTGDPAGFVPGNCATQRNLDARGRAQAARTGAALRAAGVTLDRVWTSRWCRARDTAALMQMGTPEEMPPLESFFDGRGDETAQTGAALALIAALPEDTRLLIVTHQVNITALTGLGVGSGEIIVTRRGPAVLVPVGRHLITP